MHPDPEVVVEERPTVYRPSDDSYLLLGAVSVAPGERFLEVGAGAGLVALHAARITDAVATDVNPDAVDLLRKYAKVLKKSRQIIIAGKASEGRNIRKSWRICRKNWTR